jgi:hypothetical protein
MSSIDERDICFLSFENLTFFGEEDESLDLNEDLFLTGEILSR